MSMTMSIQSHDDSVAYACMDADQHLKRINIQIIPIDRLTLSRVVGLMLTHDSVIQYKRVEQQGM